MARTLERSRSAGRRSRGDGATAARALGWFSLGLGLAQVLAPRAVGRLIGVPQRAGLMRALGARELACGAGLLARPRSPVWRWMRVAGDAMDLALLAAAYRSREGEGPRIAAAASAVAGVAAADLVAGLGAEADGREGPQTKAVVTIDRPVDEMYRAWRTPDEHARFMTFVDEVRGLSETRWRWTARVPGGKTVSWETEIVEDVPNERVAWRSLPGQFVTVSGTAWFRPAPGGRGTIVHVEMDTQGPGGAARGLAGKVFARIKLRRDLQRFKQWKETGEVAVAGGPSGRRGLVGAILEREERA